MVTTGKMVLQHKNVMSLLYFSRDLNFIILTFFSTFYFSHPALLVTTFKLMLRPKHKHSNSQQFQFIQFQSKQLQLNSSLSCQKNSTTSTMHHIQNLSTKNKIKIPPKFQLCYTKDKFQNQIKKKKKILPLFALLC